MSISLLTFGCRLNAHESDSMAHYARQGQANDAHETDTIIVNTCTVTAEAERQARQAIRRAHRKNPEARIIVTGCASERNKAQWAALPGVQRIVPNADKMTPALWGAHSATPPPSRHIRALLQVQQGCDHRCTFCVIPFGRGDSTSTPLEEVIQRGRILSEDGHHEIVLTGVDLASWRIDDQGLGFLCHRLLQEIPALHRLRLSSIDPILLDPDKGDRLLWDLIANEPRFMPHLHLSLQAGSDLILKRMKRRHNTTRVAALIARARQLRPTIGFGADVIAGFPTETDELFNETHDFLLEQQIPFLHVFPYSERPNTPAARMPALPKAIRQERAAQLRQVGDTNRALFLSRFIGDETTILMESATTGHTPEFANVQLEDSQHSTRGMLQPCCITRQNNDGTLLARTIPS
ncbi:MiaB/RimO family radical SAM methylthiotransferase [Saccharibacter sp. 17.LH.SD]|uniref:MiaB/RimO family radical SAM methylthiotransferase n=1 Tax=Saccharibacter sp. 17.LH.SD TaxID=2689393 RepID=UPI0013706591|nr:MiaB/RimO family radical SAM methylthiotransferase [Saccharibacter sp. 17.LH.SD]MXV45314.1 MiaB/RimO family radical SAM methylthiotransferase [Saccharibacter sp. 17.LH.SD]